MGGRLRRVESESEESAEEYIGLTVSEHDAERDGTAAGAPVAYVDLANGPAAGPVASAVLRLVVKTHALGQETVKAPRPRPYRA
jgi:hypothetical protein